MTINKYKWKCRLLVINTNSHNDKFYKHTKKKYQSYIKQFHKKYVKLITKVKKNERPSLELIDFDGSKIIKINKFDKKILFSKINKLVVKKKVIPTNLSLFSDYNPKTTTKGLGYKDKKKAIFTIKAIKHRDLKYQVNVIATMLGRAKNHPNKTEGMNEAIKVFKNWMIKYKRY